MSNFNVVFKKDYDSNLHKDWKTFGEVLVKSKKDLLGWLAEQRTFKDAPTEDTHPDLFERNPTNVSHYLGNPNVKAPHSNLDYTPEQLREYKKCMEDPIYFAETYVKIMSVDYGTIPFTLYNFQKGMIETFRENRFSICKLPRQCGKSTTSVAFILWYILFNQGKNVGILANKGELAQELLGRLQLAYESLPFWLQQGVETYNKRSINLENGSRVIATSSSGSAARGMSFSLIFLDEFAFVPPHDAEDFFRSVYPTISSGADTKMIVVSTPKGMNHFYKMWMEAQEQRSAFKPIEINWWDVPGRDDNWKQEQIANTSEDQFRQEFETQFIGSASTLISPSKLSNMSFVNPKRKKDEVDRVISRFYNFYNLLISRQANLIKGVSYPKEYLEFCDKMNNDLNVSGALGIFFTWMKGVMKKIKAKNISDKGLGEAWMFLSVLNDVFDFIDLKKNELPNDVRIILKKRMQARQVKDYALSDLLRSELEIMGWKVEDSEQGQEVFKNK